MRRRLFLDVIGVVSFIAVSGVAFAEPSDMLRSAEEINARAKMDAKAMMNRLGDEKTEKLLREATTSLEKFTTGAKAAIPKSIVAKAKCIAVFPSVTQGAIVIGGAGGNGIATCRTGANEWSNPAFVDYTAGSLGVQLGVKSSSLVALFLTDKAREELKQGKLDMSADIAAAAGNAATEGSVGMKDMVLYDDAAGAFLGASLSVAKISEESSNQKSYYHQTEPIRTSLEKADVKTMTTSSELQGFYRAVGNATSM